MSATILVWAVTIAQVMLAVAMALAMVAVLPKTLS